MFGSPVKRSSTVELPRLENQNPSIKKMPSGA